MTPVAVISTDNGMRVGKNRDKEALEDWVIDTLQEDGYPVHNIEDALALEDKSDDVKVRMFHQDDPSDTELYEE